MQLAYTAFPMLLCCVTGTELIVGLIGNFGCSIRQLTSMFDFTTSIKNQGKKIGSLKLNHNACESRLSRPSLVDSQAIKIQLSTPSESRQRLKMTRQQ